MVVSGAVLGGAGSEVAVQQKYAGVQWWWQAGGSVSGCVCRCGGRW